MTGRWRRALGAAAAAGAALCLAPAVARACPACASREDGGLATGLLLAAIILLPFAVVAIVARIIRRGESQDVANPR